MTPFAGIRNLRIFPRLPNVQELGFVHSSLSLVQVVVDCCVKMELRSE